MNPFAFGAALLGIAVYAHTLRQARTSPVTGEKITERKLIAGFLFFIAVSVLGSGYTPVEHGATSPTSATPALLWASFLLAVPQCVLLVFMLRRRAYPDALKIGCLSYLLIGVFDIGLILLVNGALDFTPPQRHLVKVVGKRYLDGTGKSSPKYILVVNDWSPSGQTFPLAVEPGRYRRTGVGAGVELEIGRGFLGIEWISQIKFSE